MRVIVASTIAIALAVGSTGSGQTRTPDLFEGTWVINRTLSKQFEPPGEPPAHEVITIKVDLDGVQHYTVDMNGTFSGYDVKYNDGQWHPYMNRKTKQQSNKVMLIKADERTHFRIFQGPDGTTGGVMMRRMDAGGTRYTATFLNTDGKLNYVRVFDKQ